MTKIARILIAVVFIFSAISKLVSLPFFDGLVAELLIGDNYYEFPNKLWWTQVFTRLLVTLELALGMAVLLEWKLKKLIIPGILAMLLLFSIHLFYEGNQKGFWTGNCGCFGDVLPMSYGESIIKNLVTAFLAVFIWLRYKKHARSTLSTPIILSVLGLVSFLTLFMGVEKQETSPIIEPLKQDSLNIENKDTATRDTALQVPDSNRIEHIDTIKKKVGQTTDKKVNDKDPNDWENWPKYGDEKTMQLLSKYQRFSTGKAPNFNKGHYLVAMFSMSCSHCKEVIRDMCAIGKDQLPSTYLFNSGTKFEQNLFFGQAGGCQYPHVLIGNYTEFKKLLEGKDFPRIMDMKDGKVIKEWDVNSYSLESFKKHFGVKEKVVQEDPLNPLKKDSDSTNPKLPWE